MNNHDRQERRPRKARASTSGRKHALYAPNSFMPPQLLALGARERRSFLCVALESRWSACQDGPTSFLQTSSNSVSKPGAFKDLRGFLGVLTGLPQQALHQGHASVEGVLHGWLSRLFESTREGVACVPSAANHRGVLVHLRHRPKMLWPAKLQGRRVGRVYAVNTGQRGRHAHVFVRAQHLRTMQSCLVCWLGSGESLPAEHKSIRRHSPVVHS